MFGSQNLMVLMNLFGLNHDSSERKGHHLVVPTVLLEQSNELVVTQI